MAPSAVHHHQILPIKFFYIQVIFTRKPVMDEDSAAKRLPGYLKARALPQVQHRLVEDPGDHVDILSQIRQDLSCILRRIFKRDQLELDLRAKRMDLRPQLYKNRRRKFTVGIIVAETARCVSDISVQRLFILYFLCFLLASPLLL